MKRYSICLLALIFLLACHKDSDEVITIIENPDPPAIIVSTRLVTILENSWIDSSPEQLTFAGQTLLFNDVDFKQIKGAGIDRDYELIHVKAESNVSFYKVASLSENDVNYIHVILPNVAVYHGETTSESNFQVASQTELIIPAGSLQHADDRPFQGSYSVVFASIAPDGSMSNCIPSFTAVNDQNARQGLMFESCYYLTVISEDDEVLKLSNGAYLSVPSSELPEWVFDVQKGLWIPNKEAGLDQENKINLDASGYYARAEAKPLTRVKGTLQINGSLTPHYPITISYSGQERVVHTTNTGAWAIQLPSETSCQIAIQFACGDTQEISLVTNSENEMVANLDILNDEIENVLIKGTTRDCGANPLADNFTIVNGPSETIFFSEASEINIHVPSCISGSMDISSYNAADGQSGPSVAWPAADTIDIHSSFACNQARDEYLSLLVSGEKKMYWNLKTDLDGDRMIIEDDGSIPDLDFKVFVEGLSAGLYDDTMLNILFEDMNLGTRGYSLYCPTATSGCGFTEFTITHFAETEGQWIRGHFEGKFWIKTFNPLTAGYRTVAGEFQVYREF